MGPSSMHQYILYVYINNYKYIYIYIYILIIGNPKQRDPNFGKPHRDGQIVHGLGPGNQTGLRLLHSLQATCCTGALRL